MPGRVLIVDDIASNLKLLEAKLSSEYYDVITADGGHKAIDMARRESPDLILLDVMMPGLDGFEACKILKSDPVTAHIPVVMVTALSDAADRVRGLQAGADDFLSKPVRDVPLFARVRSLIRLKQLMDVYLVREDDGFTLIDTALGGCAKSIVQEAQRLGSPIVRIVPTHAHTDHIGGLDALHELLPEAEVAVPARDARFLAGDMSLDADEPQAKLRGGWVVRKTRPARLLQEGDRVGSLEVGKDGDISIWDKDPLSSYAKVEKTIIDGEVYFDSSLPGLGLTHWKNAPMSGSDSEGSEIDEEMGIGEAH